MKAEKKLVVIAGPTAVGKTAVSVELARRLKTEIISADSRQFFRELNIGTAKPDRLALEAAPHHFIDTLSIREEYDAARYGEDALAVISERFAQHNELLLCGGSGLYIKAVCEGFDEIPEIPAEIRQSLNKAFEDHGLEWLQKKMEQLDPDHYREIDPRNPHRLIRALEVRIGTGISITAFQKQEKKIRDFNIVKVGLELSRGELYRRIDDRMDKMIASGLFTEAEGLYAFRQHQALQTVGYQEIFAHMDGGYDRDEAIRLMKRNSRRYAKRQLTWFKRDPGYRWFHPDAVEEIMDYVLRGV